MNSTTLKEDEGRNTREKTGSSVICFQLPANQYRYTVAIDQEEEVRKEKLTGDSGKKYLSRLHTQTDCKTVAINRV